MIAARRPYGLVFPLVLVFGGLLVLMANLGTLPEDAGWRLLQLWPLLLVMLGIQLLVPHVVHGAAVPAVTLLLVGLIAVGGFAYALAGPSFTSTNYTRFESTSPVAGITAGTVTIDEAGAQVTIRAASVGDQLYQAKIDYAGSAPQFNYDAGQLRITTTRNNVFDWSRGQDIIDLTLNPSAAWTVHVNGAGSTVKIDFTAGNLHSFTLDGVGGNVTITASRPNGAVSVGVNGVGTGLTLEVPAGSEYRVTTQGIGTTVDGTGQTSGWATAADRYDVTANGVGSHVKVRVVG